MRVGETGERALRLAVVISHPTQHHAPLFRRLAATAGLAVRVFHCCDWGIERYLDPGFGTDVEWDVDLLSGYESEVLSIRARPAAMGFFQVDNPEVGRRLEAFDPDAIWLHGYGQRTIWRAAAWARRRAALIHFGDSELVHARSRLKEVVRQPLLRWHFRRCDAFVTIGDNNEAYYLAYGVPREKLFRGAYPVDVARFREALASPARAAREIVRARYALSQDDVVFVLLGKLEPRKRPTDLVEAIAIARGKGARASALLIGDGRLREEVAARAKTLGIEDKVRITGFVNQRELPSVLSAGDVLVTTSDFDPHPLAVTEGMAVGLPVIASDRVGCIGPTDAAQPGRNALVFRCGDTVDLADRVYELTVNHDARVRMASESARLVWSQDVDAAAAATLRALLGLRARFRAYGRDIPDGSFSILSAECTRIAVSLRARLALIDGPAEGTSGAQT